MPEDRTSEASEMEQQPDTATERHPLECKWTLWYDNPQQRQSMNKFGQGLRPVYSFETIEDFWCLYNNVKGPSQLTAGATYYLFKSTIEPKWEDPHNANGGCWTATVPRTPNANQLLDTWWLNTVLACIGEQFTEGDEVCGVSVNIRAGKNRIEMWTKTAANEALQVGVGKQLKSVLDMSENVKIGFSVFADKLTQGKARDRYTV